MITIFRFIFLFFVLVVFFPVFSAPLTIEVTNEAFDYNDADMTKYDEDEFVKNKVYPHLDTDDHISFAMTSITLDYRKKFLNSEIFIRPRFYGRYMST